MWVIGEVEDDPTYSKLDLFIKKYPYSAFRKALIKKLKTTIRILKNEHTQYDIEDMSQVEKIIVKAASR